MYSLNILQLYISFSVFLVDILAVDLSYCLMSLYLSLSLSVSTSFCLLPVLIASWPINLICQFTSVEWYQLSLHKNYTRSMLHLQKFPLFSAGFISMIDIVFLDSQSQIDQFIITEYHRFKQIKVMVDRIWLVINWLSFILFQCSYYPPCKSSKMANEKAVRDYEHMYGQPGKKFTCLYNPKNPTEVIRTRRFHLNHVIHGMVWSSLVFILSLAILIVAIRKKGCDFQ